MFIRTCKLVFVFVLCFIILICAITPQNAIASEAAAWVNPDYNQSTEGWGVTHFSKIQDAVNAVPEGGTVNVGAGTYNENVVVEKSLKLIGSGKDKTKISVKNNIPCVSIKASNVDISGFTFEKPSGSFFMDSTMYVYGNKDINISNNSFIGTGITFGATQNSTLKGNSIKGVGTIMLSGASGIDIENNNIEGTINQGGDIFIFNSVNNKFVNNNVTGKPYTAPCTGIRFVLSSNNLIAHNTFKGFRTHILLTSSDNCIISDNDISKSWSYILNKPHENRIQCGMILHQSRNNTIINNHLYDFDGSGIRMFNSSSNNVLQGNIIENAGQGGGIELFYSSNENRIINNEISKNSYGIILNNVSNNRIYKNNLKSNVIQGYDNGSNLWTFDGAGNYWSDIKAVNKSGTANKPYIVCPGVYDTAPAVKSNAIVKTPVPKLVTAEVKQPVFKDISIDTKTVWENKTVELDQVLNINNGGSLTLRNVNMVINGKNAEAINVLSGGNLEIYNCKIEGRGQQIMVNKGGKIRVENSTLDSLCNWDGGGALYIESDGAIIKNNIIRGGYAGIKIVSDCTNDEITGNFISECSEGINLWNLEKGKIIISNNTISNTINTGIQAGSLMDSTINGNNIKNAWGIGILLRTSRPGGEPKGNTIYNNNFIDCRVTGLLVDGNEKNTYNKNGKGNYWSDYSKKYPNAKENKKFPGTWNIRYRITSWDIENKSRIYDPYPLMSPYKTSTKNISD